MALELDGLIISIPERRYKYLRHIIGTVCLLLPLGNNVVFTPG